MDVLGDAVMKHVACRVTVDGTLPEPSPVEAPLIPIGSIIKVVELFDVHIESMLVAIMKLNITLGRLVPTALIVDSAIRL